MIKHIAFCPDITGETLLLSAEESHHCIKVLRLHRNDTIGIMNGKGILLEGSIEQPDIKKCQVRIISTIREQRRTEHQLHIGISPIKQQARFEWFIEKAVELGVAMISPLLCDRTEKPNLQYPRLENLIISAAKQSGNLILPILNQPQKFTDFILQQKTACRYIGYCGDGQKIALHQLPLHQNTCIIIGPEGDFSPREISLAINHHFSLLSLGEHRYRTETAGIIAAVYCSVFNQTIGG